MGTDEAYSSVGPIFVLLRTELHGTSNSRAFVAARVFCSPGSVSGVMVTVQSARFLPLS
jgi:hypothetical protein